MKTITKNNALALEVNKSGADTKKYALLILSILFDLIGMLTYALPVFGEFFDIIWAPISAVLLWGMYRGSLGMIGGVTSFFEEILPGIDVIPTFTIVWIYKFYINKK